MSLGCNEAGYTPVEKLQTGLSWYSTTRGRKEGLLAGEDALLG